jgi:hypothetical protein
MAIELFDRVPAAAIDGNLVFEKQMKIRDEAQANEAKLKEEEIKRQAAWDSKGRSVRRTTKRGDVWMNEAAMRKMLNV